MAGHISRHNDLLANELLSSNSGTAAWTGRPHLTYIGMLRKNTSLSSVNDILTVLLDSEVWRKKADGVEGYED